MSDLIFTGATARLASQLETAFRTPPAAPATRLRRFSKLVIGQDATLQDNDTINSDPLAEKRQEMDSTAAATGTHILCLNEIGFWLTLLWGAPVTTGDGPFVHTFTLDLAPRPSALLELSLNDSAEDRFHRFLGFKMQELSWDVMEAAQKFNTSLIGAVEVKPFPETAFYATPAALYPELWACTRRAAIYDVEGASTLGEISKGSVKAANNHDGYALADGQEGFGCILLGEPAVTGTLSALFRNDTLMDHALSHASKKLVFKQMDKSGTYSMVTTIPNAEFDRPKVQVENKKALVADGLPWRAHAAAGAEPVTIVLTNTVASYTA